MFQFSLCCIGYHERHMKRTISNSCFLTMFPLVLVATLNLSNQPSCAQISAGGTPPSFTLVLSNAAVPTVSTANVDNATLIAQAEALEAQAAASHNSIPYKVAEVLDVNWSLNNSGSWTTLADGTRIWRLRISSPGADAIHLIYNRWWFPKYCELFLYNDSHTEVIGAFTMANKIGRAHV
jgi:hypothetical protein